MKIWSEMTSEQQKALSLCVELAEGIAKNAEQINALCTTYDLEVPVLYIDAFIQDINAMFAAEKRRADQKAMAETLMKQSVTKLIGG